MMLATSFALFNLIILLMMLGMSIYGFILFVKLANRGIKALDIFIDKHKE
jgi:predicted neutral ceramidase superfamily lipid hydrolase